MSTFEMEATNESILINPESKFEIHVEFSANDSENEKEGVVLNKRDSIESTSDNVISPLQTSTAENGESLKSAGKSFTTID